MKTKSRILILALLSTLFLSACKDKPKDENTEIITAESAEDPSDDIVTSSLTDKDGKELKMRFNNTKGTATLNFQGETIEMKTERAASGIWYKNDLYELRGKGNDIQLTKDGTVIFEHMDDIQNIEAKNKKGDVLYMTFNNTEGTVKAYLNGGEQIDLVEKKPASGIWYNNDQYALSGKGDSYTLKKDGKIVFQN
ncbi:MAG TPA: MliC family protein [Aequorivita sp.]|nr:MliC family protein [Aequorivita sp.]